MKISIYIILACVIVLPMFGQSITLTVPQSQSRYDVGAQVTFEINASSNDLAGILLVQVGHPFSVVAVDPPFTKATLKTTADMIGSVQFVASAVYHSGSAVTSQPVQLSVEPTSPPDSFQVSPAALTFSYRGEQHSVVVLGKVQGQIASLSSSALLQMTVADPNIVSVGADHSVTALATGKTALSIRFGNASIATVPITVQTSKPGDLDGNGIIDQDDVNLLLASINSPASVSGDARDLNGDGLINRQDADLLLQQCVTACTITVNFDVADVNMDGVIDCSDIAAVQDSFGAKKNTAGYNAHADVNGDGQVDIRDLSFVSRRLPAGTTCSGQ